MSDNCWKKLTKYTKKILSNYEKTSKLIEKRLLPTHVLWYYVNNYNLVIVCPFQWRNRQVAQEGDGHGHDTKKVRGNVKNAV